MACICVPSVHAAHHYNDNDLVANEVTMRHYVLEEVQADRAGLYGPAGDTEREDKWQIWAHFTVDVTNIIMYWESLDGVSEVDSDVYTDKWDDKSANVEFSKTHDNFPTYVDNMMITITYSYGDDTYTIVYAIYSTTAVDLGGAQGDGSLAINYTAGVTNASQLIPDDYKDTDGSGFWSNVGNTFTDPMDSVIDMIRAPYKLLRWATLASTILAFFVSGIIIYASLLMLIKFQGFGAEFGAGMMLLVGISMFAGTFFEGIGELGF